MSFLENQKKLEQIKVLNSRVPLMKCLIDVILLTQKLLRVILKQMAYLKNKWA